MQNPPSDAFVTKVSCHKGRGRAASVAKAPCGEGPFLRLSPASALQYCGSPPYYHTTCHVLITCHDSTGLLLLRPKSSPHWTSSASGDPGGFHCGVDPEPSSFDFRALGEDQTLVLAPLGPTTQIPESSYIPSRRWGAFDDRGSSAPSQMFSPRRELKDSFLSFPAMDTSMAYHPESDQFTVPYPHLARQMTPPRKPLANMSKLNGNQNQSPQLKSISCLDQAADDQLFEILVSVTRQ